MLLHKRNVLRQSVHRCESKVTIICSLLKEVCATRCYCMLSNFDGLRLECITRLAEDCAPHKLVDRLRLLPHLLGSVPATTELLVCAEVFDDVNRYGVADPRALRFRLVDLICNEYIKQSNTESANHRQRAAVFDAAVAAVAASLRELQDKLRQAFQQAKLSHADAERDFNQASMDCKYDESRLPDFEQACGVSAAAKAYMLFKPHALSSCYEQRVLEIQSNAAWELMGDKKLDYPVWWQLPDEILRWMPKAFYEESTLKRESEKMYKRLRSASPQPAAAAAPNTEGSQSTVNMDLVVFPESVLSSQNDADAEDLAISSQESSQSSAVAESSQSSAVAGLTQASMPSPTIADMAAQCVQGFAGAAAAVISANEAMDEAAVDEAKQALEDMQANERRAGELLSAPAEELAADMQADSSYEKFGW